MCWELWGRCQGLLLLPVKLGFGSHLSSFFLPFISWFLRFFYLYFTNFVDCDDLLVLEPVLLKPLCPPNFMILIFFMNQLLAFFHGFLKNQYLS